MIALQAVSLTAALIVALPFATVVIAAIVAAVSHHALLAEIMGAGAGGGILALGGTALTLRPVFRRLTRGYKWERAEYVYRLDGQDGRHHKQIVRVRVVAISPWLRVFENRYQWTGQGREETPRLVKGGNALMGPVAVGAWRYYYIHLGAALRVGEARDIEVVQELYDEHGEFRPFLAKTVIEPIDHLVLRLVFAQGDFPDRVFAFEGYPQPTETAYPLEPQLNPEACEVRLDVPNPVYGRRYWITWEQIPPCPGTGKEAAPNDLSGGS